jgi:hypothetical protein
MVNVLDVSRVVAKLGRDVIEETRHKTMRKKREERGKGKRWDKPKTTLQGRVAAGTPHQRSYMYCTKNISI